MVWAKLHVETQRFTCMWLIYSRLWWILPFLKQTYLQSTTTRLEEMRVKRRDAEQWMSHRLLPEGLRERIRRYEQYKWQETRGVDEENLLSNLPKDLRRDIKRHLCLALLMRVSSFTSLNFVVGHVAGVTSQLFKLGLQQRGHIRCCQPLFKLNYYALRNCSI